MKVKTNNLLSVGLISCLILITISVCYYLFFHLPSKDAQLFTIETQKLELQQKQIDLDNQKLLLLQVTPTLIQKAPSVDCEAIARAKARETLAKLIQMYPDNQELKKAYDAGLARTSDLDRYFDQCMQSNGQSNSINVNVNQ